MPDLQTVGATPAMPDPVTSLLGVNNPRAAMIQNAGAMQAATQAQKDISAQQSQDFDKWTQEYDALAANRPERPQLLDIQPNFKPSREVMDGFALAGSVFAALAMLGASSTRAPMTTAMNSFAGFMKGWATGNQAMWEREYKQFKVNLDAAVSKNNQMIAEYRTILDDHKMTLDQKMQEWKNIASKYDHDMAVAALDAGDAKTFMDMNFKLAEADRQAQQHAESIAAQYAGLAETRRYHDLQIGADLANREVKLTTFKQKDGSFVTVPATDGAAIEKLLAAGAVEATPAAASSEVNAEVDEKTEEWLRAEARFEILTGKKPTFGLGKSALRDRYLQLRGEEMMAIGGPEAAAAAQAEWTGGKTSLNQLVKWRDGVARATGAVDKNMEILKEYAGKLGLDNLQMVNKAILAGKRELNDPIANAYINAAYTVMNEYARAQAGPLSSAMLHEGALARAQHMLNTALSPEALDEVGNVMHREMQNLLSSTDDQINYRRDEMGKIGVRQIPEVNEKGWKLMQDAAGNKAYVSPDGSEFEELQ